MSLTADNKQFSKQVWRNNQAVKILPNKTEKEEKEIENFLDSVGSMLPIVSNHKFRNLT